MPSIAQYRAFVSVIQTGSVTAAAEQLGRTQPQISRQVASLEEELGFDLFSRERRRLMPTARGARFYEETRRALDGVDNLRVVAEQIADKEGDILRVLAPTYVAHSFLPAAIARLRARRPSLRVTVEIVSRNSMGSWISFHPFDVGIVTLPFDQPGVEVEHFATVQSVVVLPRRHRLSRRQMVTLADLSAEPCILLTRNTPLRQSLERIFEKEGFTPSMVVETSSSISACELAAEGIGWTIADAIVCQPLLTRLQLVSRNWKPGLLADFGLIYSSSARPKSDVQAFAESLRSVIKSRRRL